MAKVEIIPFQDGVEDRIKQFYSFDKPIIKEVDDSNSLIRIDFLYRHENKKYKKVLALEVKNSLGDSIPINNGFITGRHLIATRVTLKEEFKDLVIGSEEFLERFEFRGEIRFLSQEHLKEKVDLMESLWKRYYESLNAEKEDHEALERLNTSRIEEMRNKFEKTISDLTEKNRVMLNKIIFNPIEQNEHLAEILTILIIKRYEGSILGDPHLKSYINQAREKYLPTLNDESEG